MIESIFISGDDPLVDEMKDIFRESDICHIFTYDDDIQFKSINMIFELTNISKKLKRDRIQEIDKKFPKNRPVITSSVTVSAGEISSWISSRPVIGISALPTLLKSDLYEYALPADGDQNRVKQLISFLSIFEKDVTLVQDRVGMVFPRILCMIINEATSALMDDIASPEDIDTAMKLGTNYPYGPLEWADKIGIDQVYAVISALHNDLGEERYRPTPLLKQMALEKRNFYTN